MAACPSCGPSSVIGPESVGQVLWWLWHLLIIETPLLIHHLHDPTDRTNFNMSAKYTTNTPFGGTLCSYLSLKTFSQKNLWVETDFSNLTWLGQLFAGSGINTSFGFDCNQPAYRVPIGCSSTRDTVAQLKIKYPGLLVLWNALNDSLVLRFDHCTCEGNMCNDPTCQVGNFKIQLIDI